MATADPYVRPDEHGVLRVGGTHVMLDSVLAAWGQGHSRETIRSQYPALNLEQVYGAIAWSLAHPDDVASYLQKQQAVWDSWRRRSEAQPSPLRDRLRAAKQHAGIK